MTEVYLKQKIQPAIFQQETWCNYITKSNLSWASSLAGFDNSAFFFSEVGVSSFHLLPKETDKNVSVNFLFSKSLKERFINQKLHRIKRNSRQFWILNLESFLNHVCKSLRSYNIRFLTGRSPSITYSIQSWNKF